MTEMNMDVCGRETQWPMEDEPSGGGAAAEVMGALMESFPLGEVDVLHGASQGGEIMRCNDTSETSHLDILLFSFPGTKITRWNWNYTYSLPRLFFFFFFF